MKFCNLACVICPGPERQKRQEGTKRWQRRSSTCIFHSINNIRIINKVRKTERYVKLKQKAYFYFNSTMHSYITATLKILISSAIIEVI